MVVVRVTERSWRDGDGGEEGQRCRASQENRAIRSMMQQVQTQGRAKMGVIGWGSECELDVLILDCSFLGGRRGGCWKGYERSAR